MKSAKTRKFSPFSALIAISIVVLSILACQITGRIVISQHAQKIKLTEMFASRLQDNAIFRARSLDPEAQWLQTEENISSPVRSYIEENLASMIRLNGDELSKDSNLAWIIRYNGKEYTHNWKDSFEQEQGALDYTIRSSGGKITYQGTIYPTQAFSRQLTILVNPSIVPEDRLNSTRGTEYTYSLTLPDDFSIRYYIPTTIRANGGEIAQAASSFGRRNILFASLGGSLLLFLIVMLWRWEGEKNSFVLSRFVKLKALVAWGFLGLLLAGMFAAISSVGQSYASGTLLLMLRSFGLSAPQAKAAAFVCPLLLWMIFFGSIVLMFLYIKFIFKEGFSRYLHEDTLTALLLRKGQSELAEAFETRRSSQAGFRLIMIGALLSILLCVLYLLVYLLLGPGLGLILGFILGTLALSVFLWGAYRLINRSYQKVIAASEQLASGNFTNLKEQNVGYYQPLYDELSHIAQSCQQAVKEGLASQITKTQLISNVSHDLKTPVAGIQSYSELISLSDNMDDIHEYAKRLSNYSMRLSDLIADLFDVAKATSGDIKLDPIDLDLSELVMQVAAEWTDQFEAKKLKPVLTLIPNAILHLDPGKTVRVIENLLSNICKYSLANSRVFIDLYAQDGLYQLVLKNTSNSELNFNPDQIVERFVRGDSSRHETGSGLGLAIVKSFVEVQQGTFEVKTDGDLFKACISFAIPPVPQVPSLPAIQSDEGDENGETGQLPVKKENQLRPKGEKYVQPSVMEEAEPESPKAGSLAQADSLTDSTVPKDQSAQNRKESFETSQASRIQPSQAQNQKMQSADSNKPGKTDPEQESRIQNEEDEPAASGLPDLVLGDGISIDDLPPAPHMDALNEKAAEKPEAEVQKGDGKSQAHNGGSQSRKPGGRD